jgi:integrase
MIDIEQERMAHNKESALDSHLTAFEQELDDNTGKHVKLTMSRVRRIVTGCGFTCLGDLEVEKVRSWLKTYCRENDIGHRTYNHYVQAIDSFCNWCVETKRLLANPLNGMELLNAELDVRHQRRALTHDEFVRLVTSALSSDERIQCYSGEHRARIYTLSYMTGLRRAELASLTPRSFQLSTDPPTVTIEAACSKHRRKDVLPLHLDLVDMLKEWLVGMRPDELLFPKLAHRRTWFMVKKDLERVGIPYETADGIADFHAAGRHTHITELLRNGASLPEARKLARHSDIKMTMRYTHIGIEDQARALAKLPSLKPAAPASPPPGSALQMRCISGGFDGHSVSRPVGDSTDKKGQNPCQGKGFDADRRQVSPPDKVEAAGIEPASRDLSTKASTCVAGALNLPRKRPPAHSSDD